jgi:hypothetical protein
MTRAFAIACLCLFATHAGAQEAAPVEPDVVVRALLDYSGQKRLLGMILAEAQDSYSQVARKQQLTPAEYKRFQAAMKKAFQFEPLYQVVFEHYRAAYHPQHTRQVLDWMRGPEGQKIMPHEQRAARGKDAQARRKYAQQLQARPLPATREALIEQVKEASRATELNLRLLSVTLRSAMTAANAAMPEAKRVPAHVLEEVILRTVAKNEPGLRQSVRANMLYTYRNLTDDELRAYFKFFDSDAGRWYVRTGIDAHMKALELAGTQMGTEMGKIFSEKDKQKRKQRGR